MADYKVYGCPVIRHIYLLEKKWCIKILIALLDGTHNFNALQRKLVGITPKMLSMRLKELEKYGIIKKSNNSKGVPEYYIANAAESEFSCWHQKNK